MDSFEIHRNNVVYSYQKNRNPFIDHSEYVDLIWTLTGIEIFREPEISVYPNPAKDFVNIELPHIEYAQAKIYTARGETVVSFKFIGNHKLSTTNFDSGLYLLHVITKGQNCMCKIVIEN